MKRENGECHGIRLDYLVYGFDNCVDDTPTDTGLKLAIKIILVSGTVAKD